MMFLRNVLFCLSGVSLQRYHSADFGLIKKTLFHTVSILAVLLLMTSRIMLLSLLLLSSVLLYGKTVWCLCMVLVYGDIRGGHFRQNSDISIVVI